jgi:biotin carboxyl carrier protein
MKYKVTLNGKTYEVEVEAGKAVLLDEYEACAPAPAAAPAAPVAAAAPAAAPVAAAPAAVSLASGEPVNSPMPGNILSVNVKEGDKVKAGQVLAVLEAMKMETEIPAPKDGTVVQVVTSKGAVVETGSPLIVLA